ncbi:MAG: Membrane protein insertase, YidC/Oxa1 family [Candidatus Magasanikbacteria bacterium GW2011_GWA2_46_17]|uniref:Membrane protein insertase, YidC/Oxa1 family n=1 Tax=Candidatus Magasanikbacteria bacterium GW2011_GWA2_46_17 TaxID=1619042 RepID=A0A0G1S1R9_9BACT|nr:MAG: Membrane protein insertase, YidC/Oxa1 family [Candidatus Magasanikbacteria bacterium GW2011_GWA2_46_17]
MSSLFTAILYKPIFNLFVGLYNLLPGHDVGLVILIITLLVRLLLYPLTTSMTKAQKAMQELQPKLDDIKKTYADDKQKQSQAIMELYKNNKVNPFASCLPMVVQIIILIALWKVLMAGLASQNLAEMLYPFVQNPGRINPISFGLFDLSKPNIILAILAGAAQFWQAKMMSRQQPPRQAGAGGKDENMMAMMNKQMLYMMPILTVIFGISLPAGLTLYWFFSTLLMGFQQMYLFRKRNGGDGGVVEGKVVEEKK